VTLEQDPLAALRAALDAAIVGHDDAKTALALGLAAREHVLLIGPSGCGKTALAEAFLASAGGEGAERLAFHRDTRAAELLGDAVLLRSPHGRGERLALRTLPGALMRAALWLLDDLSRAPGEALAPLLRLLAERTSEHGPLALEVAVATVLPLSGALHADPLEPTQLDRFALQVRMRPLAMQADATQASALLARAIEGDRPRGLRLRFGPAERAALARRAAAVAIPDALRAEWLGLWRRLAALSASAVAAPPSDRAIAHAGVSVLRAHALLAGRSEAQRADLRAARFMLAARVPEALLRAAEQLVERSAAGELAPASSAARTGRALPGGADSRPDDSRASAPYSERAALLSPLSPARHRPEPADVSRLVRALVGRIDRANAERAPDPGGAPRRPTRLRRLDDAGDADPVELALWAAASSPGAPTVLRRERRSKGGALVLLRDVSASMEGARTRLAADVVAGVLRAAAKRRMRVGYVEFHHDAEPFLIEGALFHRRYRALNGRARIARAEGRTSYEAPLRVALHALRERAEAGAHVLLLTDGVPVVGDPRVLRERRLARELGARIHTVFLGAEEAPEILRELAAETGGLCFQFDAARRRAVLVPARGTSAPGTDVPVAGARGVR
jgi:MoxR-like ATPase